jgi:excisionase family DNA binding protein
MVCDHQNILHAASGRYIGGRPINEKGRAMQSDDVLNRKTYRVDEAARLLGIGPNAAYSAIHAGELPVIRVGGRLLIPKAALDRMLAGEAA